MTITIEVDGNLVEFPDAETAQKYFAGQSAPKENVIATTDKGGRVVRMDNGELSFASPGFSTNNQATIERIMNGTGVNKIVQEGFDQSVMDQAGKAAGFAGNMVKGIPFAGEWVDEAVGKMNPQRAANMNTISNAYQRQNPKSAMAARMGGGVAAALPAAAMAMPTIGAKLGASMGAKVMQAGLLGASAGATEGVVSGGGVAEGDGRMANAKDGAIVGGLIGGIAGGAAPVISAGVKSLLVRLKGTDIGTIAKQLGISKEAAITVKSALDADDLTTAAAALNKAGDGAMLLDASDATRSLAQAVSKSGGKAQNIIQGAVGDRVAAASDDLIGSLDNTMGKSPTGLLGAAEEIAQRTAPARTAAYDEAFSTPIDYASQQGRQIEEVLSRIPPNKLTKAITAANERMMWRGTKNKQILADIAEDGSVQFMEMPNVEQLNELKIQLDEIGRGGVDAFGRPTADGILARDMARGVRDATVDAVPSYGTAVKIGGDKIAMDRALETGSKLFRVNTTREDVIRQLAGASSDELNAAKAGVRMYFDDTLANIKKVASDPNIEARQLNKAWQELSSPAARQKVEVVLGQTESANLFKQLDQAEMALGARAAVSRNSDTAINQAIQKSVEETVTPGAIDTALSGQPVEAIRATLQKITGANASVQQEAKAKIFAEIATALTQQRGKTAENALKLVDSAMKGQKLTEAQASQVAKAFSNSVALSGYQYATQRLKKSARAK